MKKILNILTVSHSGIQDLSSSYFCCIGSSAMAVLLVAASIKL